MSDQQPSEEIQKQWRKEFEEWYLEDNSRDELLYAHGIVSWKCYLAAKLSDWRNTRELVVVAKKLLEYMESVGTDDTPSPMSLKTVLRKLEANRDYQIP